MKKILILAFVLISVVQLSAQAKSSAEAYNNRVGYVNTEEILNKIPEYSVALQKLEVLSENYREIVESEYKKIEALYQSYQRSKSSMSETMRSQKESEIITKERAIKDLQSSYFGTDGIMQKKSEEFLGPIKDKVQVAINFVAQSGNFMLILDIASIQGVVFVNQDDNLNSEVLKNLEINHL